MVVVVVVVTEVYTVESHSHLQENFKMNGIENVKIARLSSEEFNEAYLNLRTFQRTRTLPYPCVALTVSILNHFFCSKGCGRLPSI